MQIKVVDENSAPLAGAEVTRLAPSIESRHSFTDSRGFASVPYVVGGNMIRVKLSGFETVFISTTAKIPASVTLKKYLQA